MNYIELANRNVNILSKWRRFDIYMFHHIILWPYLQTNWKHSTLPEIVNLIRYSFSSEQQYVSFKMIWVWWYLLNLGLFYPNAKWLLATTLTRKCLTKMYQKVLNWRKANKYLWIVIFWFYHHVKFACTKSLRHSLNYRLKMWNSWKLLAYCTRTRNTIYLFMVHIQCSFPFLQWNLLINWHNEWPHRRWL